ncbi:hypothetical protein PVNG_02359 [Plasmodium vivax North Korean]|uniref:ABC transporter domain-containing protein n=1 Tax=Plasmodium vivax North Korean TaxID=1035514 RepID=A0A0J9TM35_PLAVI|nr:hypothetical protein PVNG_02359 [Plasmodium vivax North Korean]
MTDSDISKKLQEIQKKPDAPEESRINSSSLELPLQGLKNSGTGTQKEASKNILSEQNFETSDQENLFPDNAPLSRDPEKDLEEEEHEKMKKEYENIIAQGGSPRYDVKDFPLAEPELINKLCESHMVFFHLLSKLQETHTPSDFATAYHIQDRIAYLIDNQTLLYRTLTKKLIKYLDHINEKLKKYYDEITLKQEDLRKINAQITRFNEYDRKTQARLENAGKETELYRQDIKKYESHLDSIDKKEAISKRYDAKGRLVLDNFNLTIEQGSFVTLIGPSGSGKTTILNIIAGFIKPDKGKILLSGIDIKDIPPHKRPTSTVFQDYALFPHLNVYENISFGLKRQKIRIKNPDKDKLIKMNHYLSCSKLKSSKKLEKIHLESQKYYSSLKKYSQ